jgi:glycerol-3-phosphate dehydrogenase
VRYAARHEYAQTATDFLARRSRLSFLNAQAALDALPRVIEIMSEELGWTRRRQKEEWYSTRKWLMSMGLPALGELEGDKDAGGFSYTAKLNNAGEWIKRGVGLGNGEKEKKKEPSIKSRLLSRAVFSAEELDLLRKAFNEKIGEGRAELKKEELKMLVRDLGYDEMSDRALDDASYGRKLLRYEDFLDVSLFHFWLCVYLSEKR